MRFVSFLKSILIAPMMAILGAIIGLFVSVLVLLANGGVHWIADVEPGQVSRVITVVAKQLPLIFGVVGFFAAFTTKAPIRSVFGSARWADPEELKTLSITNGGLLIGRNPETDELLRYHGPAHLLTMAPTRTGKGVGTIIPNLLMAERSIVCVDPKGENAIITARRREGFGTVHILDPFGITGKRSAAFNPLDQLDPDGLDIAEDTLTLADAIVHDDAGTSGDAHWNEEAKALISGLMLMVVCSEPRDRRHLGTLRDYLTLAPERFAELLARMQAIGDASGLIARAANRHLGKSDREAAGVLSAAQRHTHFLDSPRMVAVLNRSDFRFADLKHRTTTVFLVLPPDRLSAYSRWLRLIVSQSLVELARDQSKPPAPVLFLLDEFAALGHLPSIETAMGLMAGYGVQLWPILQDIHQLRATYGRKAGTFLSNAAVLQVFGVNDTETADLVAKTIGKTDVKYLTGSWGEGKHSTSEHIAARDLINADEIMRLPGDRMILLRQGQRPAWVAKLRYYEDREFRGTFDKAER